MRPRQPRRTDSDCGDSNVDAGSTPSTASGMELTLRNRRSPLFETLALLVPFGFWAVSGQNTWAQVQPLRSTSPSVVVQAKSIENADEDLSSLPLESPLESIPPLLADVAKHDGFTLQLVQVGWRRGDLIDLYIIKPEHVEKPPVILYLYGYPSETDRFTNEEFDRLVTRSRFAAVGFVEALDGHRYHDRPMRQWFVSELPEALVTSVHDVQMVLNYLSTRGDLDMSRVGMFGQGSGGTIAILSAQTDPRIKAIDVLDPWGSWPEWIAESTLIPDDERPDYTTADFLRRIAPLDPVQALPRLNLTLHLQDALYERQTPAASKKRLELALPKSGTVTRYATTHEFKDALVDGKLLNWIKGQLQATVAEAPGSRAPSR